MDKIVQEAEDYVRPLLEQLDEGYCYHDLAHTLYVKEAAEQLSRVAQLNEEEKEILLLAAIFHDTGFIEVYKGHEKASGKIARAFLEEKSYRTDKLKSVLACIAVTEVGVPAETKLQLFMKDADLSNLGRSDYLTHLEKLRREWKVMLGEQHTDQEWYTLNHQFLKTHQYNTPAANTLYRQQSKANQKLLKKMAKANKDTLKKGIQGSKSAQMMFKTSLRNHLDLSNLADNKANIMLSVNALIITIAMPVAASYISQFPYLLPAAIVLLCTCLASMIFATLATRPIKMSGFTGSDKIEKGESNLFFFGNFYRMSLSEYQAGMAKVVEDDDRLEGSIMRDLYYLGHSLGRKYNLLRICYNIFMLGVILGVIVFIIAYFLHH